MTTAFVIPANDPIGVLVQDAAGELEEAYANLVRAFGQQAAFEARPSWAPAVTYNGMSITHGDRLDAWEKCRATVRADVTSALNRYAFYSSKLATLKAQLESKP